MRPCVPPILRSIFWGDPEFEPTPWWHPGDRIACSDCGADLDPEAAIARVSGKQVGPICAGCDATRRELDELLD